MHCYYHEASYTNIDLPEYLRQPSANMPYPPPNDKVADARANDVSTMERDGLEVGRPCIYECEQFEFFYM